MPTRRSTLAIMHRLRGVGVIDAPWPEARWEVELRAEVTPIELIQWRFAWDAYIRNELLDSLTDFLQEVPRDDYGLGLRLRIWEDLIAAESERFFEDQLTKHNLDPVWSQDLTFAIRDSRLVMPISQWRYCCWAASRFAAAQAHGRRFPDFQRIREDMYVELLRRAQRVASGDWDRCAFVPFNPTPQSAGSRIFTRIVTGIGSNFWTLPPSAEGISSPWANSSAI